MKKIVSLLAVAAFMFSVDAMANEPKNKDKKKKAQTEQATTETKPEASTEEKKSCGGSEKKACCSAKKSAS